MNLIPTQPTEAHITALCRDLRESDRVELEAFDRGEPAQIIREALATSQDCTAVLDGEDLLCIFGVNEQQEAFGLPWMLTTEHAQERHMRRLLPLSKHVLGQWLGHRATLCNLVHEGNTRALRWLKWMGFEVLPGTAFTTPTGAACRLFTMKRGEPEHV